MMQVHASSAAGRRVPLCSGGAHMAARESHDRLTVRRLRGGFAVDSGSLYCWDDDPARVIETAEVVRSSDDARVARPLGYAVDASDRIVRVGRGWSAFARSNTAPELAGEAVIGRSLWAFVSGHPTRSVYQRIFDQVRLYRVSVEVPFRCDSPEHARWMQLAVLPREHGALELRSTLVRERCRVFAPILGSAPTVSGPPILMCSFCKECRVGRRWVALDDALAQPDLFEEEETPRVLQRVCDRCESIVREELRGHSPVRTTARVRRTHRTAS